MKNNLAVVFCLSVLVFAPAAAQAPRYPFSDPNLPAEKRIDNLLSLMTTEEKINCLGTRTGVPRLGVPNIGSSEGIHGVVQRQARGRLQPITTTQFPQPPGMGETWDPDLVRQAAAVEGYEARFITQTPKYNRQILMLWGPQADLARDPRWGRSEEVYGEDPFFNGTMAVAFIKGLQGDNPKYWQAAALLKHFLANSNEDHRNVSSSDFDERLFWEYYSVPFRMGFLEGGAKAVMASYNAWNGTAMAVNPILRTIVRDQLGCRRHLERRRRRQAPGRLAPSLPEPGSGRGRMPESRHQPVPRPLCRRNPSRSQRRLSHRGRHRRGAAPQVPHRPQAGTARPAGPGPVLQHQRLARALEHRQSPRRFPPDRPRIRRPSQEREELSSARQEVSQVDCRDRPACRLRPLGLVRRHASLCGHSFTGHQGGAWPRCHGPLRRRRTGQRRGERGAQVRCRHRGGGQRPHVRPRHGARLVQRRRGRRRHAALHRAERRPRRPGPRNDRPVPGTAHQAGLRRQSEDGGDPRFQLPVRHQLDPGPCSRHPAHGARLSG